MDRKKIIGQSVSFSAFKLVCLLACVFLTLLFTLHSSRSLSFADDKLKISNGRLHIGTNPGNPYGDAFLIEKIVMDNTSASKFLVFVNGAVIPTSNTTNIGEGMRFELDSGSQYTNYDIGGLIGATMLAVGRPNTGTTINSLIGGRFYAAEYGTAGGTITEAIGGRFEVVKGGNNTIDTAYGIYIADINGAANNYAIYAEGGAYSDGIKWYEGSSREYKENIRDLNSEEALLAFNKLNPVTFTYKVRKNETRAGFIAEDVPELVASKDRKGLSPIDIVAVLTKVIQEQEKTIAELSERVQKLEKQIK